MLTGLSTRGFRWRPLVATLAVVMLAPMVVATPASADEPGTTPGGTGSAGGIDDYLGGAFQDPDGNTEATVGAVTTTPCVSFPDLVNPADIPAVYRANPPQGEGRWEYQVCAKTKALAQDVVNTEGSLAAVRQYCFHDKDQPELNKNHECAFFVSWHPKINAVPDFHNQGRGDYFRDFLTLSPQFSSQPKPGPEFGSIANFPSWFWLDNVTTFPFVVPDFGLFGGGVATAWHLESNMDTNNEHACRETGLRKVGADWKAGTANPEQPSPKKCGYTYPHQGIYNVHSCSQWLIVVVTALFAFAFPITFCNDDQMTVKESQIVTGGDPRRAPAGP
jgi:hypothetical protein